MCAWTEVLLRLAFVVFIIIINAVICIVVKAALIYLQQLYNFLNDDGKRINISTYHKLALSNNEKSSCFQCSF